jgi:hypothetical protein
VGGWNFSPYANVVARYDSNGQFVDIFLDNTQLTAGTPQQLLVSPDGKNLVVKCGQQILQFDMNGVALASVIQVAKPSGYATFYSFPTPTPTPKYSKELVAIVISIVAGIYAGDSGFAYIPVIGWVRVPGNNPELRLLESQAMAKFMSFTPPERDATISLAIQQLSGMLSHPEAQNAIQKSLMKQLTAEGRSKLNYLMRSAGGGLNGE